MSDTYNMRVICSNCLYQTIKTFDKGKTCDENYECPNCGCFTLHRT